MPRPYQVFQENDSFSFTSECLIDYSISFADVAENWIDGNPELSSHCKLFTIKKKSDICSKKTLDSRIGDTVCYLIDLFLSNNPTYIVFFIADDSDKRSTKRLYKFSRWYDFYTKHKHHNYIYKTMTLPGYEYKVDMGYIYNCDHELRFELEESIELFSDEVNNNK